MSEPADVPADTLQTVTLEEGQVLIAQMRDGKMESSQHANTYAALFHLVRVIDCAAIDKQQGQTLSHITHLQVHARILSVLAEQAMALACQATTDADRMMAQVQAEAATATKQ